MKCNDESSSLRAVTIYETAVRGTHRWPVDIAQSIVLRADRFHRRGLQNPKAKEECMGIKVNIWNRLYLDEFRYI